MRYLNIACCLIILLSGCVEKENTKNFRIAAQIDGLQLLSNYTNGRTIFIIPLNSKVEIVDNKIINNEFIKIKFKDNIGYVNGSYLTDKETFPYVENIKYDYSINEFIYNNDDIVKFINEVFSDKKYINIDQKYFYTDDPQIFTFYGKDCSNLKVKKIAVRVISKINKNYNTIFTIGINENKLFLMSTLSDKNYSKEELINEVNINDTQCCDNSCD